MNRTDEHTLRSGGVQRTEGAARHVDSMSLLLLRRVGALGALLSSTCAPPDGVAVSLAARHVYHYDLRCESFPQVGW